MTKDEALKMAAEALERSVATCFDQYSHQQLMSHPNHFINQAITAIKEALAQPEEKYQYGTPLLDAMTKDYVPPQRPWQGLTDEDLDHLCHLAYTGDEEFVLTVQAKLKEKNT